MKKKVNGMSSEDETVNETVEVITDKRDRDNGLKKLFPRLFPTRKEVE